MKTLEKGAEKWIEYNIDKPHQLYDVSNNLKKDFVRIQKYWKNNYARSVILYLNRVQRDVLLGEFEKELNINRVALYRWVKRLSELGLVKYKSITRRKSFIVSLQVRIKTVGSVKVSHFRPENQDVKSLIIELLEKADRPLFLTEISEKTMIPISKLEQVVSQDADSAQQKFQIVSIRLLERKNILKIFHKV